jgi:hypothetical protein
MPSGGYRVHTSNPAVTITLRATIIAERAGERRLSETELAAARFQGKHVVEIASKLVKGRASGK